MVAKAKTLFHINEGVIEKKNEVSNLTQERKVTFDNLKQLINHYNTELDLDKQGDWTSKLPFETLKELEALQKGRVKDSLAILNERIKTKKEYEKQRDRVEVLEHKIKETQIELLLAKIGCVEEKL